VGIYSSGNVFKNSSDSTSALKSIIIIKDTLIITNTSLSRISSHIFHMQTGTHTHTHTYKTVTQFKIVFVHQNQHIQICKIIIKRVNTLILSFQVN
jgi:hypothetical protein